GVGLHHDAVGALVTGVELSGQRQESLQWRTRAEDRDLVEAGARQVARRESYAFAELVATLLLMAQPGRRGQDQRAVEDVMKLFVHDYTQDHKPTVCAPWDIRLASAPTHRTQPVGLRGAALQS